MSTSLEGVIGALLSAAITASGLVTPTTLTDGVCNAPRIKLSFTPPAHDLLLYQGGVWTPSLQRTAEAVQSRNEPTQGFPRLAVTLLFLLSVVSVTFPQPIMMTAEAAYNCNIPQATCHMLCYPPPSSSSSASLSTIALSVNVHHLTTIVSSSLMHDVEPNPGPRTTNPDLATAPPEDQFKPNLVTVGLKNGSTLGERANRKVWKRQLRVLFETKDTVLFVTEFVEGHLAMLDNLVKELNEEENWAIKYSKNEAPSHRTGHHLNLVLFDGNEFKCRSENLVRYDATNSKGKLRQFTANLVALKHCETEVTNVYVAAHLPPNKKFFKNNYGAMCSAVGSAAFAENKDCQVFIGGDFNYNYHNAAIPGREFYVYKQGVTSGLTTEEIQDIAPFPEKLMDRNVWLYDNDNFITAVEDDTVPRCVKKRMRKYMAGFPTEYESESQDTGVFYSHPVCAKGPKLYLGFVVLSVRKPNTDAIPKVASVPLLEGLQCLTDHPHATRVRMGRVEEIEEEDRPP